MKNLSSFLLLFIPIVSLAQTPPAPPPPIFQEVEEEIIFGKIEEIPPFFPGCLEEYASLKQKCSEQKMLEFLYGNLKYPKKARKKKCQGTVYLKFVVEKDGTISNHEIVRDIGCGCGEKALRVIKLMPVWEPATQRGRPVRVQFNMPIKFRLE